MGRGPWPLSLTRSLRPLCEKSEDTVTYFCTCVQVHVRVRSHAQGLQVPAADEYCIYYSRVHSSSSRSLLAGCGPLRSLCKWPVSNTHRVFECLRPETPSPRDFLTTSLLYHWPLGPGSWILGTVFSRKAQNRTDGRHCRRTWPCSRLGPALTCHLSGWCFLVKKCR